MRYVTYDEKVPDTVCGSEICGEGRRARAGRGRGMMRARPELAASRPRSNARTHRHGELLLELVLLPRALALPEIGCAGKEGGERETRGGDGRG
jgi:hypothetical protein